MGQDGSEWVRKGKEWSGEDRPGEDRTGQERSGQVRTGQNRSEEVKTGQVKQGQSSSVTTITTRKEPKHNWAVRFVGL